VNSVENVEATAAAADLILMQFHKKDGYRITVPLAPLRQAEASER
jgi:hypothetical protein